MWDKYFSSTRESRYPLYSLLLWSLLTGLDHVNVTSGLPSMWQRRVTSAPSSKRPGLMASLRMERTISPPKEFKVVSPPRESKGIHVSTIHERECVEFFYFSSGNEHVLNSHWWLSLNLLKKIGSNYNKMRVSSLLCLKLRVEASNKIWWNVRVDLLGNMNWIIGFGVSMSDSNRINTTHIHCIVHPLSSFFIYWIFKQQMW